MFVPFCIQIMCFSFLFCLVFAFRLFLPVISVQRMLSFTRICWDFMVCIPTSVVSVQNSQFSMSVLSITPSDMLCNWSAECVCLCMQQSTHIMVPLPLNFWNKPQWGSTVIQGMMQQIQHLNNTQELSWNRKQSITCFLRCEFDAFAGVSHNVAVLLQLVDMCVAIVTNSDLPVPKR